MALQYSPVYRVAKPSPKLMVFHRNPSPSKAAKPVKAPSSAYRTISKSAESLLALSRPAQKHNQDNRKTRSTEQPGNGVARGTSYQMLPAIGNQANGLKVFGSGSNLYRSVSSSRVASLDDSTVRASTSTLQLDEANINVVVRVRPPNDKERKSAEHQIVEFPGHGQLICDTRLPGQKQKLFSFNVVFEPAATQEDILEYSGIKRLLEMAVDGFSCTAFCYGQTGSGKTHTLTGPPGLVEGNVGPHHENHGLIVRSFVHLFRLLRTRTDCNFILKASYLEIYNEKVIDLLNPGTSRKPLQVRWSKQQRGFYVENLFMVDCEELDDLFAVLEEGMRNRAVGSHAMNEKSSRSHTVLTVRVRSERAEDGTVARHGKINFVDLAGSELTKRTQSSGATLEEANNINKSLMVLGYCIASLSDQKRKGQHIPYRDSKLTKLLADSLAGNGVTLMIACISPSKSNACEIINTLRYAARAKKIKTKPVVKMDARDALILSLRREVNALQEENDHLKSALQFPEDGVSDPGFYERRVIQTPPQVELEKLAELKATELAELVKLYMHENQALRQENAELFNLRDIILRDQELVCRENERLLKKLEDVNSVCCRSPIIPARPTYAETIASMPSPVDGPVTSDIWTNPHGSSGSNSIISNSS